MPSANVNWPIPLVRQNPWYPGQMGVPGGWTETGLRDHCTGAVFYVDPNHPGATAGSDGTDPTNPITTVAIALTKVQSQRGDVIAVMMNDSWQYAAGGAGISTDYATAIEEEVTIPYTAAGVRIVGISSSAMGVPWYPASNAGVCITNHAIDVVIEGFAFSEGPTYAGCNAIACEWDGVTLFGENMTVRNCLFDDTVDTAVALEYSWYCDIHNNYFQRCDAYGVYADTLGSGVAYCSIHDNVFHDCAIAVSLLGGSDDNQVCRNSVYNTNAQAGGAATNEGIDTTGGTSNMVFDNFFSCLLPVGPGDYADLNSGSATDAWVNNHCMNGDATTNP